MQILGAISKDEKACFYTNVIPSDTPQDLYGESPRRPGALNSDVWVSRRIEQYVKQTVQRWTSERRKEAFLCS